MRRQPEELIDGDNAKEALIAQLMAQCQPTAPSSEKPCSSIDPAPGRMAQSMARLFPELPISENNKLLRRCSVTSPDRDGGPHSIVAGSEH